VPAGHHPDRGSRPSFDHAHRIRQPVGALEPRRAPGIRLSSSRTRPGSGSILAVVAIALLAIVLRPWTGILGSWGEPRQSGPSGAPPGATPGLVAAASGMPASIGPHGDRVTGPEASIAVTPAPSVNAPPASAQPLPAPLLEGYAWPLRNARITNGFGAGRPSSFRLDGEPFHDGIDIASFCGARITAAHDGVVLGAGRRTQGLMGWIGDLTPFRAKLDAEDAWRTQAISVVIDDGNGYRSVYAHLGVATVEKGDIVMAGDLIGWEGASGNATGCHLHYAIFNPLETATLELDPKIAKKNKLPATQIARIDPLLVLPPPSSAEITWGWGAR
jgi:murein DD-endopeptidase MepM/ murein hydrolase activator NlpD